MLKTRQQINDEGGCAFPMGYDRVGNTADTDGMSLRDYFAGKALVGELASQCPEACWNAEQTDQLADYCYKIAHSMLKARQS